ncbi:inositol monophosphatase [Agrobacterium sp. a22-2]|uniref:inositol monophosphatase family protein n=1 Tax=Agrobacterium sp. a22-2 TaxID=2283840 RepID=UPI0014479D26|nr:inositol monophosphatase [Agrobacterium sp. a22-2]NKN38227.1 inositol monophosphatase [Agrobacterium sp. a22-2]
MNSVSDDLLLALMGDMRQAAEAEILPRFRAITADAIRAKSAADDIVTDADIAAERFLSERLTERLPGIAIVGEEAVSDDPSILSRLAEADLAAVIDPVDGTWHFAHGVPMFGSILAIVSGGETIAGLIHYPILGDFVMARRGGGAWHVAVDGTRTRLSVAAPTPIEEMHGFIPLHMFEPDLQAKLAPRVLRFLRTTTWRCSAWEYRMLATGAMSFCLNESLKPWDHAAGVLIHAEAGGYAAVLTGEPYRPTMTKGHLLTAPSRTSWENIAAGLF